MGSLSRTVRQQTCWSSSASSLPPWPPPSCIPTTGTTGCTATLATATPSRAPWSTTQLPIILLPPIPTNASYPTATLWLEPGTSSSLEISWSSTDYLRRSPLPLPLYQSVRSRETSTSSRTDSSTSSPATTPSSACT